MAAPLKLPIVITVDNGKATAGLKQFEKQGLTIKGMFKGLRTEATGIGKGILGRYFGIQSAIEGIKQLINYGDELQRMAGNFRGDVALAQAQTEIAKLQRDIRIAAVIAPTAIATENEKQLQLQRGTSVEGIASALVLQATELQTLGLGIAEWIGDLAALDFTAAAKTKAETDELAIQRFAPQFMLDFRQWVLDLTGFGNDKSATQSSTTPESLTPPIAQSSTTPEALAAAGAAESLHELREINRHLRGLK